MVMKSSLFAHNCSWPVGWDPMLHGCGYRGHDFEKLKYEHGINFLRTLLDGVKDRNKKITRKIFYNILCQKSKLEYQQHHKNLKGKKPNVCAKWQT